MFGRQSLPSSDLPRRIQEENVTVCLFNYSHDHRERNRNHRTGGVPGLKFWGQIADGGDILPLRKALEAIGLDQKTKDFIAARDDETLRKELIQRITWQCGSTDITGLAEQRRSELQASPLSTSESL